MIIRAPTRTKTNSFNGPQMSFKFPSTESLRDATLDEYHLNNHHLLNDNVGKSFDEVASQILSDYTSTSNTNTNSGHSSNGYYSFANISDNTTSSPKPNSVNNRGSALSGDSNAADLYGPKTPALEPVSHQYADDDRRPLSRSPPASTMEVIPEGNGFTSFSTAFHSIPTAANISFDIASTASSRTLESDNTTVRKSPTAKLQRTPTITRIQSGSSTRSSWESTTRSTKLKRSKAVRCKGGLLQYFILLGLTLKRQLRKVICSIRSKLGRNKKGGAQRGRASLSPKRGNHGKGGQRIVSGQEDLRTSHLQRTQRYVSNLQRSMSCKSLQPVLMSKVNSTNGTTGDMKASTDMNKRDLARNPTTSLRRTNSSIKRAASVITTPHRASDTDKVTSHEPTFGTVDEQPNGLEKANASKPGIVRSTGSHSLSSLVRQPSIVVKNKVIPLSMHHYSIEEEEEDSDEYVISTRSMRPLTPVESLESEEESYEDAQEDLQLPDNKERKQLAQSLNHYFRAVISQRIMSRIQLAKYQESETPVSDLIGSLIKEYESDSTGSNVFEEHKSRNSLTDATSEPTEDEQEEEQDEVTSSLYSTTASLKIAFQSPFGGMQRSSRQGSLLSLPTTNVKRSLTLPIGIKV